MTEPARHRRSGPDVALARAAGADPDVAADVGTDTGGLADLLVAAATRSGRTLAVAESLTAGLVCARIAEVPGASAVLRGGVVAYATELKATLLGVDAALLATSGPVHPDVAAQMATGVRALLRADVGVSTTGVAGPGPSDAHPAGTVYVAVADDGGVDVRALLLPGGREEVRRASAEHALGLVLERLQHGSPAGGHPL